MTQKWTLVIFAVDPIESIRSSKFNKKWLPGQILSCLDLNWVQIRPKMDKTSEYFCKNFCNIFEVSEDWKFRIFLTLQKMMLKLNFENCEKLVQTRIPTQTFEFKFGMQGLTKEVNPSFDFYRWQSAGSMGILSIFFHLGGIYFNVDFLPLF